jgi:hypothetical protein
VPTRASSPVRAAPPAAAEVGDDGGALDWADLRTEPPREHVLQLADSILSTLSRDASVHAGGEELEYSGLL